LPVYDKPMIYYPLSVLMLAGIQEILIISSDEFLGNYHRLFGDGADLGLQVTYAEQPKPEGLAQAFTIGADFIGDDGVALALGDNLFFGAGLAATCKRAASRSDGATVFAYRVEDPERYGVVEFGADRKAIGLEEKPARPRSSYAITGLYFYDNDVVGHARGIERSARGEYEITDVNRRYMEAGKLNVETLGRGFSWFDTGTHDALFEAAEFVRLIQRRQGLQIACLEEIAFRQGFISRDQARRRGELLGKSDYGRSILRALEEHP